MVIYTFSHAPEAGCPIQGASTNTSYADIFIMLIVILHIMYVKVKLYYINTLTL